eukprot:scaffold3186_cov125-Isochrysis_galbana.AAC.7
MPPVNRHPLRPDALLRRFGLVGPLCHGRTRLFGRGDAAYAARHADRRVAPGSHKICTGTGQLLD